MKFWRITLYLRDPHSPRLRRTRLRVPAEAPRVGRKSAGNSIYLASNYTFLHDTNPFELEF